MKCQHCRKEKSKTFRREGGLVSRDRALEAVTSAGRTLGWDPKRNERELKGFESVCLSCIKNRTKAGSWFPAPIITNPTIKPSGDPLEWIIND